MQRNRRARLRTVSTIVLATLATAPWWSGTLLRGPRQPAGDPAGMRVSPVPAQSQGETSDSEAPPAGSPTTRTDAPIPTPTKVESLPKLRVYRVVEGDTAEGIAARFGLKTSTILWANDLTEDSLLQVGQELLIPAVDGVVHTVIEGDTLWEIASDHAVEVDEVVLANPDISPDLLQPGQQILVPNGVPHSRAAMVASRSGVAESGRSRWNPPEETQNGGLIWPLTGVITDRFGWRTHPVYGTKNFHEGIDIAVPPGTPVQAVAAGKVIFAGWYGGYGLTVKIDHGNGLVTRYSHNSELLVQEGESVEAGRVIAKSGNTGVSTGPHLDLGLYRNGVPVDPLSMLP